MAKEILLNALTGLLLVFCLNACTKGERKTATGTLINATGFDGCGWMIELDEKDSHGKGSLEIGNSIGKFNVKDGDHVKFRYVEVNGPSKCMVGTQVSITYMRRIR